MKILILTNIPSPYRVDFFNELNKYCDVNVLFERSTTKDREKEWLALNNYKFKAKYLKGFNYRLDSSFSLQILKYLKETDADIIFISGYSSLTSMLAIEYLKFKKKKFIFSCDGGLIKNDKKIVKFMKRHFISSADYWLSTGKTTDEYLLYYGAKKENIYRYPFTSIKECDILKEHTTKEEINNLKKELNVPEEKVIISIGQFIPRKGFDVLIKAAQNIDRTVGIYIIGGTPTTEYIELKEKLNLNNVHFIGFKSKKEISKYYKMANLFVLPTREDIWGLVINEAMAFGLPVITTEKCVAGLELIENEKNGYIIPINNENALSQKVNEILKNEILENTMRENNLKKIKEYTIENMAKEHVKIFNNILRK